VQNGCACVETPYYRSSSHTLCVTMPLGANNSSLAACLSKLVGCSQRKRVCKISSCCTKRGSRKSLLAHISCLYKRKKKKRKKMWHGTNYCSNQLNITTNTNAIIWNIACKKCDDTAPRRQRHHHIKPPRQRHRNVILLQTAMLTHRDISNAMINGKTASPQRHCHCQMATMASLQR
jgi:hypothetical protein